MQDLTARTKDVNSSYRKLAAACRRGKWHPALASLLAPQGTQLGRYGVSGRWLVLLGCR